MTYIILKQFVPHDLYSFTQAIKDALKSYHILFKKKLSSFALYFLM